MKVTSETTTVTAFDTRSLGQTSWLFVLISPKAYRFG